MQPKPESLLSSDGISSWDSSTIPFLVEALYEIRAERYVLGAALVIWLYDIFLTLDDEVEFVWKKLRSKRSIPQSLYVVNRYLAFIVLVAAVRTEGIVISNTPPLSALGCQVLLTLEVITHATGYIVATTIYAIRVYMIFYTNRMVQRSLIAALLVSHAAIIVCTVLMLRDTIPGMTFSTLINGCGGNPTKAVAGIFVAPMFIETVVAVTMLAHAYSSYQYRKMLPGSAAVSLLNTLYVDGTIYYLIIFVIRIADCLVYWLAPQALILLGFYFEFAMTSTLTSRWFLSLRRTVTESQTNTSKSQDKSTGIQAKSLPRHQQSNRISTQFEIGSAAKVVRPGSAHTEVILGARANGRSNGQTNLPSSLRSQSHGRGFGSPVEEVYALRDMKSVKEGRGERDLEGQEIRGNKSFLKGLGEEEEDGESWSSAQKAYD